MTMQKTDAELIAEAENQDWFIRNMAKVLHERHQDKSTPELLMLLPELARRLKAANAERDEFREKYYETLDARTAAREAEYLNRDPKPS